MAEGHSAWRRTRRAATAAGTVLLAVAPLTPGTQANAADEPGQGLAVAQATKVDPKAGGLSIGIAFGQATANHQNQVAKAISTATHMGVVGTTLAAQPCNDDPPTWPREQQPQSLVVDSRDEGAAAGKQRNDFGPNAETGNQGPFAKYGQATGAPFAKAVTRTAAMFGFPNDIEMGTTVSQATSGLVNGVREARATVDIAYLNLPGVRLSGLRWDARYESTGDDEADGLFTIGSAVVNGQQRNTSDPSTVLSLANEALKNVGIKLVPGAVHKTKDSITIEPLAVTVVPHPTRDKPAADAMSATQDYRERLFDEILTRYCRAGTYISVFDIVVGSVTGAGEFILSLGGVQASSGELPRNRFTLDPGTSGNLPGIDVPPVESSFTGTPTSEAAAPGALPPPGLPTAAAPPARRTTLAGASDDPPPPFTGTRGGALAVVGLVTLAAVALAAEADRRMDRRLRAAAAAGPEDAG